MPSQRSNVSIPMIRAYAGDHDWLVVMRELAPLLGKNYPGGDLWLARRLDDVQAELARAQLAFQDNQLVGIAIESPKPEGQIKLSTLWVHPRARSRCLGELLLAHCVERWLEAGTPCAWITVGAFARVEVSRLVCRFGFRQTSMEPDRYGPGRDEWVLRWRPAWALTDAPARPQAQDVTPAGL